MPRWPRFARCCRSVRCRGGLPVALRLQRYVEMLTALDAKCPRPATDCSLAILKALTKEEAHALDSEGSLPSAQRVRAIAKIAGCGGDKVVGVLTGYLFKFEEGLRPTSRGIS